MPPIRRSATFTDEQLATLEAAAAELRRREPEIKALIKERTPEEVLRQRVRAIAVGVFFGMLAFVLFLVACAVVGAVVAAIFDRVFHLLS